MVSKVISPSNFANTCYFGSFIKKTKATVMMCDIQPKLCNRKVRKHLKLLYKLYFTIESVFQGERQNSAQAGEIYIRQFLFKNGFSVNRRNLKAGEHNGKMPYTRFLGSNRKKISQIMQLKSFNCIVSTYDSTLPITLGRLC